MSHLFVDCSVVKHLFTLLKNWIFHLYNNVMFSIDYAKIVAEVEDIVHEPKASALCLQLRLLFSIVNAKHNIIVIIIPTVWAHFIWAHF